MDSRVAGGIAAARFSVSASDVATSVGSDKVLDLELLDHAVNGRVSELDVGQLDGRLLGDEIHLSLSFLQQ